MSRADVDEFLARVDEVTAPTCGACAAVLAGPSDYFCDAACSASWHATQVAPLDDYREPWQRPHEFPGVGGDAARWQPQGEFRLPRSTGDLAADERAARRALQDAVTDAEFAAVELRMESLRERLRSTRGWATGSLATPVVFPAGTLGRPVQITGNMYVQLHTSAPGADWTPIGSIRDATFTASPRSYFTDALRALSVVAPHALDLGVTSA